MLQVCHLLLLGALALAPAAARSPYVADRADAELAAGAPRILEHMNADHADSVELYCRAFCGASEADAAGATMVAIDRDGFDVAFGAGRTRSGKARSTSARVAFADHGFAPLQGRADARVTLVAMVVAARKRV